MCGRFTLRTPTPILLARFRLETMPDLFPRYNIAPTQTSPVIRSNQEVALLRWGLVPSWAKDRNIGARLINARGETVAEKPAFRRAFRKRRCLVMADGYYEWRKVGREKRPLYIRLRNDQPFAMAGLWERWFDPGEKGPARKGQEESEPAEPLETFTIITTESNELTADVHDRMPVILADGDWEPWLDAELEDPQALQPLLRPFASDAMRVDPVSTHVNNVRHEDAQCIAIQKELF
jgi:putative SOS response-associated peptidase YedK